MTTIPNSTGGPRTPEGKRRSSLNALKHGLDARSPQALEIMTAELDVTFEKILDDMRTYYFPRDQVEDQLVKRIARCLWRLTVSESMERRLIARRGVPNHPGGPYDRILRYERLVDIHLHRAIDAIERKRTAANNQIQRNELPPRSL